MGILSHEELMYIFDILFMHNWKEDIFVRYTKLLIKS